MRSGNSKRNTTRAPNSADLDEDGSMEDVTAQTQREEDYVYYMLAPPWARHKEPILYLQQF